MPTKPKHAPAVKKPSVIIPDPPPAAPPAEKPLSPPPQPPAVHSKTHTKEADTLAAAFNAGAKAERAACAAFLEGAVHLGSESTRHALAKAILER